MAKRLAVFPYGYGVASITEYSDLLAEDVEVKFLLVPRGWSKKGIKETNNFSEITVKEVLSEVEWNEVDAIWITEEINDIEDEMAIDFVNAFLMSGKEILYTNVLRENILEEIEKTEKASNLSFIEEKFQKLMPTLNQYELRTPVIMVLGSSIMTQKFDLQLSIRRNLQQAGFRVAQVGTKAYSKLFGFYSIPDWFFDRDYLESEKISMFNKFLKKIEEEENPDVIVVGVPEGIVPLTKKHHFNFGIYAYEICCAVAPDYTILTLPSGEYNEEFLEEMIQVCKYKFNVELDSFFVSDCRPISNSFTKSKLEFTRTQDKTENRTKYSVYQNVDGKEIVADVLEKLMMYDTFQIL